MPSVSLQQSPQLYSPVNSELWYKIDSGSSSVVGWKYVIDTYRVDQANPSTYSFVGRFKLPPSPAGYCVFSPHKVLKSFITNPLNFTITQITANTQSIVGYGTSLGFEYNPNIRYNSSFTYSVAGVGVMFGFNTGTISHGLQSGDTITINKDVKTVNPQIDGVSVVLASTASNTFVTNIYSSALPTGFTESGTVTSVMRTSAYNTADTKYAFNGTRQYTENSKDFGDYYLVQYDDGTSSIKTKFLTNYDDYKPIFTDQYEAAGFLGDISSTNIPAYPFNRLYIKTYDSNMILSGSYSLTQSIAVGTQYRRWDCPVGTKNLAAMGVTLSNITYYTVSVGYSFSTANPISRATVKRKIVSGCAPYDNIRIAFLNRLGAYEFWNFNMDSKKSLNINRTEFKKVLPWNYSIGDRQNTVLSTKVEQTYTANTDWISEYDYNFLEELVTSPEVYIIDEAPNNKLPIVITDTSFISKTAVRDRIFNFTINFKFAYSLNLQGD